MDSARHPLVSLAALVLLAAWIRGYAHFFEKPLPTLCAFRLDEFALQYWCGGHWLPLTVHTASFCTPSGVALVVVPPKAVFPRLLILRKGDVGCPVFYTRLRKAILAKVL